MVVDYFAWLVAVRARPGVDFKLAPPAHHLAGVTIVTTSQGTRHRSSFAAFQVSQLRGPIPGYPP